MAAPWQAVTSALADPYVGPHNMSAHYYQAYMQYGTNDAYRARTNTQGYTLSSTYNPDSQRGGQSSSSIPSTSGNSRAISRPSQYSNSSSWYRPGDFRCVRHDCSFMGSRKSTEIHMMDRHLIFPPGWEKSRKSDWDADPTLKGKTIPIQGTNILLDTPEALEAWIAERKKRFPTAARVAEKIQKTTEAVARGQLMPEDLGLLGSKRRRSNEEHGGRGQEKRFRGTSRGRGRGRGNVRGIGRPTVPSRESPAVVEYPVEKDISSSKFLEVYPTSPDSESEDDNDAPQEVSSKAITVLAESQSSSSEDHSAEVLRRISLEHGQGSLVPRTPVRTLKVPDRPAVRYPKKQPQNMFASSSLLKNLLLPEIRITVSNLSQAIHFLVDNDLLRNVEMTPGESTETLIEVLNNDTMESQKSTTQNCTMIQ